MLGVAGLLLNGLQSSRIALLRTQAVMLASDIGDRIRANRTGGASYALASGTTLSAPPRPAPRQASATLAKSPPSTCMPGSNR
jgi:type IV pilus assembly protein PilV